MSLFVCLSLKEREEIFSPRVKQFPKHIQIVVSSGSAAICVFVCVYVCVFLSQKMVHYVDDAVTAVGILDEHPNLKSHQDQNAYRHVNTYMHARTHSLLCPLQPSPSCPALVGIY